ACPNIAAANGPIRQPATMAERMRVAGCCTGDGWNAWYRPTAIGTTTGVRNRPQSPGASGVRNRCDGEKKFQNSAVTVEAVPQLATAWNHTMGLRRCAGCRTHRPNVSGYVAGYRANQSSSGTSRIANVAAAAM